MKRMLLSSSECFQFFFPLESFTGRGRKTLRSYLFPFVQKSYPCLSDSVAWDFTVFNAGGKRWASVCAVERETLAVLRLKNPRCALYTLSSCVCRSKDFEKGKEFSFGNERVFFDTEKEKPCFETASGKASSPLLTEREILFTQGAVQVFSPFFWNTNGTEKRRTLFLPLAVLFLCVSAAVLIFALNDGKKKTAVSEKAEEITFDEEAEPVKEEVLSAADYLCECGRALYADGALLLSFRYEENEKLFLSFKSRTPSQVLFALEDSHLFSSAEVKDMVFEGEKALCSVELTLAVNGPVSTEKKVLYPEKVKTLVPVPSGVFSLSEGRTLLSFEARKNNLESFMKSIFGCEGKDGIRVVSLEITSGKDGVPVKCGFEAGSNDGKDKDCEYDFSFLSSLFPEERKPALKAAPVKKETEPEEKRLLVGKTRGTDGSYTYFYKSEDGKIVSEKKYECE